MQIRSFQRKNTGIKAILGAALLSGMSAPQKAIAAESQAIPKVTKEISLLSNPKESPLTMGMPRTVYYEHGQQIEKFEEPELWDISSKLFEDSTLKPRYQVPLPLSEKPYIAKEGLYGAPRGAFPHMGVDFSIQNPTASAIPVLSPVDGILVGHSKPTRKSGTNQSKIMGEDGKIFVMEYFSNPKDTTTAKHSVYRRTGTQLQMGDTIGFVSRTPRKDVFQLHFAVEDLDVMAAQENDSTWRGMKKFFNWKIAGNVNPLDSTRTGGLANKLNQLRIEAGKVLPIIKQLGDAK